MSGHTTDAVRDNLQNWNDRAETHAQSTYGDLNALADDPLYVSSVVRRDLGVLAPHLPMNSVAGQRLLHLQCHIGTDTLSWWRLGASEVHGLDFSPHALNHARALSARAGADITYVRGDARHADEVLSEHLGSFDVIVTSAGTITWLPDLEDWGRSIARLLAPGGIFMIRDNHPLLFALDNNGLEVVTGYVSGTESFYETAQTYMTVPLPANDSLKDGTPAAPVITHTRNHNWAHDFQEITGALLGAGLTIEALGEHEQTDWKALPQLKYHADEDAWSMPDGLPRIPLTFSLVARRPQAE